MKIAHTPNSVALSNAPRLPEERRNSSRHPGLVWDSFKPTPPMSTYLLAIVVSNYVSTEFRCEKVPNITN